MGNNQSAVVIGGSHAAVQLVISLRQNGWQGSITVVSDEPYLPYQRPPLSKAYLAGDIAEEQLALRASAAYDKLDVSFLLGVTVLAIDTDNHRLRLDNGEYLGFSKLALCTGARARTLPIAGVDLQGVHYLRNMDDVKGIQQSAVSAKTAVIIGGGYIGLETAASLTKQGIAVTLLEAEPRLLQRVASQPTSDFYQRLHKENGVTIRCNAMASALMGDTRVKAVVCSDGDSIETDMVIIGIGVIPNTELASAAALEVDNGILVNEFAQSSHPDIVAAGDCTSHLNPLLRRTLRLESVPNATEQAKAAAASICGLQKQYAELPWFWSDQYDVKLQIAGMNQGYTDAIIRGDITSHSFSVFYIKDTVIIAADCINRPKDFMLAKKLILHNAQIDPVILADETTELKTLLTEH
ncbi:MAG: oxidoreductase [Porticoccaceae bacterium]|jgi:3-phenylpropionate/trans-cinnamate dioxygenase ferredoxin reductase component|nr:oxidoreductase [Porticoccaceae bacterium]MBT5578542.1 oxidoreductase [Porticoccaceae bacterium]MBT7375359.1 oxidoreductase [Porticoccaceae bacterium]